MVAEIIVVYLPFVALYFGIKLYRWEKANQKKTTNNELDKLGWHN